MLTQRDVIYSIWPHSRERIFAQKTAQRPRRKKRPTARKQRSSLVEDSKCHKTTKTTFSFQTLPYYHNAGISTRTVRVSSKSYCSVRLLSSPFLFVQSLILRLFPTVFFHVLSQSGYRCLNEPGSCLYTWCCPCFALKDGATAIGNPNGCMYCCLTFPCPFGCCALAALGNEVQEKQGIDGGLCKALVCSFFNPCTCYSCAVTNECKVIQEKQQAAPNSSKMTR